LTTSHLNWSVILNDSQQGKEAIMTHKTILLFITVGLCLIAQGCTRRAWYEGLQNRERQECYKGPSEGEIQKCLERVNSTSYDEYKIDQENGGKTVK
jgi:hypothetical protein